MNDATRTCSHSDSTMGDFWLDLQQLCEHYLVDKGVCPNCVLAMLLQTLDTYGHIGMGDIWQAERAAALRRAH